MAKIISFSCPDWVAEEIISKQKKKSAWLTEMIIKNALQGKNHLYNLLWQNSYSGVVAI